MPTAIQSRALGVSLVHKVFRVDYTELTAAAASESLSIVTLPAGAVGVAAWIDVVTAFTDAGSISALGLEIGDSADPNALLTSVDGFAVTGRAQNVAAGSTEIWASMAVELKATATGANLGDGASTDLDSGIVDVHLLYRVID